MSDPKDNKKQQSGGGDPYFVVRPGATDGFKLVEDNGDGTYNVNLRVGTVNPSDKSTFRVVQVVNGKVLDGIASIDKSTEKVEFVNVKPNNHGEILVGIASVRNPIADAAKIITVKRTDYAKSAAKPKSRIMVQVQYPGPDRVHNVFIRLFQEDGTATTGKVVVAATQEFEIDGVLQMGSAEIDVNSDKGVWKKISLKQYDEGLKFRDDASNQTAVETFLGPPTP